jgi:hypothetical protein
LLDWFDVSITAKDLAPAISAKEYAEMIAIFEIEHEEREEARREAEEGR